MSTTWPQAISWPSAQGRIGERYILGGENLTLARDPARDRARWRPQAADAAAAGRGDLARSRSSPRRSARATGREPFVTLDGLRMARKKMFFTSAKAKRELGYAPRPAEAGLADAVAWFRPAGMCP